MRKFKFIGNDEHYPNLIPYNVYDVNEYIPDGKLGHYDEIIININGESLRCYVEDLNGRLIFLDVTIQYRNEQIDYILN